MPRTHPYHPARNQRLDPELYACADRVYFITIRAQLGPPPFVRASLNRAVLAILREEQQLQNCAVFTYCLMPDHLHFLASPRQDGISIPTFAERFKGKATNRSWAAGWRGKLWQQRYYDHMVRREEDLRAIAEYILANPVRKGLASDIGAWPWVGGDESVAVVVSEAPTGRPRGASLRWSGIAKHPRLPVVAAGVRQRTTMVAATGLEPVTKGL